MGTCYCICFALTSAVRDQFAVRGGSAMLAMLLPSGCQCQRLAHCFLSRHLGHSGNTGRLAYQEPLVLPGFRQGQQASHSRCPPCRLSVSYLTFPTSSSCGLPPCFAWSCDVLCSTWGQPRVLCNNAPPRGTLKPSVATQPVGEGMGPSAAYSHH